MYMYMQDIFLKTTRLIILISYQNFFQKFKCPNLGCGLSASMAYTLEFTVLVEVHVVVLLHNIKISHHCICFQGIENIEHVHVGRPYSSLILSTVSIQIHTTCSSIELCTLN